MSQRGRGRGRSSSASYGSDAPSFNRGSGGGGRGRGGGRNAGGQPSFQSELGLSQRGRGRAGGSGAVAHAPSPVQTHTPPQTAQSHAPLQAAQSHAPQPPAQTHAQLPSSSAPPPAVAPMIAEMEQKLTLAAAPPSSSKAVRLPARPGFGTVGTPCQVRANHFLVEVAERDLHHYDVSISPEVVSKKTNRDVIKQVVHLYKESHLGKRTPAYDGMKSIYTAGPFPFASKEFLVKLTDRDDHAGSSSSGPKRKDREFKVTIKLTNTKPDLYQLQQFLRSRQHESPQEAIQVLDVVLRATPSEKYTVGGRSFFGAELGPKGELGDGMEYWRGFYQSLRPTQFGLSLNIDVSARAFYEPILVTEFVKKNCNLRDLSRPLSDRDRVKVKKAMKGVKVSIAYRNNRQYRITGVSTQPLSQLTFPLEDNTRTSVVQYYREKYNIVLRNGAMPALQSGNDSRPVYLPMELCSIVAGQRYSKKLNERQVTALLRATCQRPQQRENNIKQIVRQSNYNGDKLINEEFGMQVREDMALVNARVLAPPLLKYHDTGKETKETPRMGQWNMINKKMVNGGKVDFWAFVNFSGLRQDFDYRFCDDLVNMCKSKGVDFHVEPLLPLQSSANPRQIEKVLKDIHRMSTKKLEEIGQKGKHLQLLIIVLPDVTGSYGMIKRICETELGIVSQCCQPRAASKLSKQYLENLSLKINVKVGGRNTVLNDAIQRRIPLVSDKATIIFGADVTHPQPGEDSSPSIAAVVASMDWPEVTKYRGIVSAQTHRDEIIQDLYNVSGETHGGIIREHLIAFLRSTGLKPERIIFYRDGVSEGQFSQVLLYEMDAIRKACASLQEGYLPPVTFVVVQKRHHTRLFAADHRPDQTDRSGNIKPGTVVDTQICHPTEFDFYLNSHAGIQGTSRPAHYHVLFDENRFSADGLQILTNNLCYTYARCTRSVSIVPPAYYAHLAAFRARYYIEGEYSDVGSAAGSTAEGGPVQIRALPKVKENVKDVMFYC